MNSVLSSQQLIAAGRQLQAPFNVSLTLDGQLEVAECVQVLRLVPGRRVVIKMQLGNNTFLAKIFLGKGRRKYCRRELMGVQALHDASVRTAQLVGVGTLSDNEGEVLLLEYLHDAQQLSECVADGVTSAQQQLASAVELMAAMHNRGLRHNDCHLDNFLANERGLYLIDGDAVVQAQGALSTQAALANVALFFVQLPLIFNHQLADFFDRYCQAREESFDVSLAALMAEVTKQRDKRQSHFLKKVFRNCTQFKVEKNWSRFVVCNRLADSLALQALIANPDEYIEQGALLKDGNSATVARVSVEGKTYVVKRYNVKSFSHWLTRFWRASRAWMSWRNAQLLCFYGILTPAPVAMIEERWGFCRRKAYFITESLDGDDVLSFVEKSDAEADVLDGLVVQFARLFEQMKLLRLSHGDFKATNFLLDQGKLSVIDLDSMNIHHNEQSHQKAFAKDQQRFLKNWSSKPAVHTLFAKAVDSV